MPSFLADGTNMLEIACREAALSLIPGDTDALKEHLHGTGIGCVVQLVTDAADMTRARAVREYRQWVNLVPDCACA